MDVLEILKLLKETRLGEAWGNSGGKVVAHNKYIFLPCFNEVNLGFFSNRVPNLDLSLKGLEKIPTIFLFLF